jgi:hypothetical protein
MEEGYLHLQKAIDEILGDDPMSLSLKMPGRTVLLMGNEAIARGALEAGAQVFQPTQGTLPLKLQDPSPLRQTFWISRGVVCQ